MEAGHDTEKEEKALRAALPAPRKRRLCVISVFLGGLCG